MVISYKKRQEVITVTRAISSHLGIKNHADYIQRYTMPNLPIESSSSGGMRQNFDRVEEYSRKGREAEFSA